MRTRRILFAALTAVGLSLATAAVCSADDGIWQGVCAMYAVGSVEWYLFQCYLLPASES